MSPTSCHCSTPRRECKMLNAVVQNQQLPFCIPHCSFCICWWAHGPTLPAGFPPVPSALRCFTTRFGMGRGGSTALRARHWFRGAATRLEGALALPLLCQGFSQGSPRPCAPLACTCHHASSCGRSPRHLRGGLPGLTSEGPHLGAHFPLRCFQRFLLPDIATQPAGRPTTAPPAVRPRRSSRTKRSSPQDPKRP
jgi:hypothetical protein